LGIYPQQICVVGALHTVVRWVVRSLPLASIVRAPRGTGGASCRGDLLVRARRRLPVWVRSG